MAVKEIVPLRIIIAGTSPLLLNNPLGPDGQPQDPNGSPERKLYRDEHGRVGIPADMLMQTLIRAGRGFKVGRRLLSKANQMSYVPDIVRLRDDFLTLEPGFSDWSACDLRFTDRMTGRVTRITVPMFERWQIPFYARIFFGCVPNLNAKLVRELLKEAGDSVGFGFRRPEHCGTYGRFRIHDWKRNSLSAASKRVA